jgi:hypothetical protein
VALLRCLFFPERAAAIAAERIRSGAADHTEDGAKALATLGIKLPPRDKLWDKEREHLASE